jgi:hypothetical protein
MLMVLNVQTVFADDASHREAAERLLVIMNMEQTLDRTIEQTLAMEIQQDQQLALYEDVMKRFFSKYMSWEGLKDDFVQIYVDEFTEQDILAMIDFYKTPTGQKAIEKTPVLFMKGAQLGQSRVQENIGELQKMVEVETERLIKMQQEEQQKQQ